MKKASKFIVSMSLSVLAVAAMAADSGTITGKITLKGTPPPETEIDMKANAQCAVLHGEAVKTKRYVVGANGELANVFVYVKAGLGKTYDAPKTAVVLSQKGCLYEPYVSGIMVGQDLEIVNDDPFMHNVHSTPTANVEFNVAQPTQGMKMTKKFSKVEVPVRFKCDVHPWMFAYICVVENPFYAVTNAAGEFKISGLPAGEYTLEVWHLKAGMQTATVKVADGGAVTHDFALDVPVAK
jgi:plastocyanin